MKKLGILKINYVLTERETKKITFIGNGCKYTIDKVNGILVSRDDKEIINDISKLPNWISYKMNPLFKESSVTIFERGGRNL